MTRRENICEYWNLNVIVRFTHAARACGKSPGGILIRIWNACWEGIIWRTFGNFTRREFKLAKHLRRVHGYF